MDALIRYTRLSKNTILQARDELVELKELMVETGGRGAGDTNHYYLTAFMESRVQKGSENFNKGAESIEKGSTHLNPNKNEEIILEEGPSKLSIASQRLDDYYKRRWQIAEDGRKFLISPSSGERVYESEL